MLSSKLAVILFVSTALGCAGVVSPRPTAIHLCPEPRPPLVDAEDRVTDAGLRWVEACLEAGRLNCVEVAAIRREDPAQCDRVLR